MQAAAICKMGAEVTQHNKLLQQLATSFPASHTGSSVHTWEFGAAFHSGKVPLCVLDISHTLVPWAGATLASSVQCQYVESCART